MEGTAMVPYSSSQQGQVGAGKRRAFVLRHPFVTLGLVLMFGLCAVIGSVGTTSFVYEAEGESMLPTLTHEERLLVNRAVYWVGRPGRGDIVVFEAPGVTQAHDDFIKRVVAVEGETVEIRADSSLEGSTGLECDGCGVYVNGVRLEEGYVRNTPDYAYEPSVVPEGHVFVLGDNRRNSSDSHVWGPLEVSRIEGKAFFSLTDFGFLR
jgi:signal peptidase I